jgi:hypothetical protein
MKGKLSIEVPRSLEEVFDFLVDLRNERSWNPRILQIEKLTDGPMAAGTKFWGRYVGLGELTTELLLVERPRQFSFRSSGARMRIEGAFVVAKSNGGTRIELEAQLVPQSFFRLLAPLMAPIIHKQNQAAGERLKRVLTTAAAARVIAS